MWALASIQYLIGTLCPSTTGALGMYGSLPPETGSNGAAFLPRKVTVTIPLDCTEVLAVMANTQA